jgi:Kef-type K+ transport system membrane component KefB
MPWSELQLQPTFGFTIIGLIVVFGPLVAEKLRLPGLLGLLVGGALIGPNMLSVLPDFTGLQSIGDIGVLYLIFLAGMQLDIDSFIKYRRISFGFGLLTAFIPFGLGVLVALAFDIDTSPAILIGSFWASFTLIAYPTISKFGLTRNPAVAATVGASSITDTISLIILALVIGAETGDSSGAQLVVSIAFGLVVVAVWCLAVIPAIARWFFSGVGQERTLRFMFVLISLTSSAVVADLVDIEPLIGAFFVGVGLNRIVPNRSPLMRMTDFFGNAFFIPTFLVSVGLLFDPEVMFVWETIRLALGFRRGADCRQGDRGVVVRPDLRTQSSRGRADGQRVCRSGCCDVGSDHHWPRGGVVWRRRGERSHGRRRSEPDSHLGRHQPVCSASSSSVR